VVRTGASGFDNRAGDEPAPARALNRRA
jgi:hypothetical protein